MPVIAPEEPQLALARGAALASANAPRYDTSTIGLAYSQDPDGTTVYPLALADDATTFLGHADASPDTADIASDSDDVPERSKPFLLGSSLTAIFVAGMMALAIAMAVSARPTVDQGSDDMTMHPDAVAPPTALPSCAAGRVAVHDGPRPRSGGTTTCGHRDGTAEGSARSAAASIGAQRSTRPGSARPGWPAARAAPSAARCASAADTAAGHPVAATDSSATALLQPGSRAAVEPGSEEAAGGPRRRRPRWQARSRR